MRRLSTLLRRLPLPLRVRLTLAFAIASALLLGGVGAYIYLEVKDGLDASLDASLQSRADEFFKLARSGDGPLRRALAVEGEPAQLLDAKGTVLAASPRGAGPPLLSGKRLRHALARESRYERREAVRLIGRPVPPGRAIVVSTSMVQRERALESVGSGLLVGGPLILLLSSGAGYLVASGALRPVERMRRRAAEISAATPDARLPLSRTRDEVRRLGETLNAMLGRLEAAAAHEREFLATASHELRTPLAILKAEVDLALEDGPQDNELRPALESIGEEADRLARLAEDLLVVARGEDGTLPINPQTIGLRSVVGRVIKRFAAVSAGALDTDVPNVLSVQADELRLEQALGNMVDNALRHGAAPITISAARSDGKVEVHVTDHGDGFAADDLPDVFERAGGGRAGGFGLGLPIVATIARAHGGVAGAANTPEGADVWITLPV
ncbi:MAG: HAMP domain-containing sensor histidine kinase [Solirubrobacteraceae bacterium]